MCVTLSPAQVLALLLESEGIADESPNPLPGRVPDRAVSSNDARGSMTRLIRGIEGNILDLAHSPDLAIFLA